MSANSDSKTEQDTKAAGVDYFVGKPFQYEELAKFLSMHEVPNNVVNTGFDSLEIGKLALTNDVEEGAENDDVKDK